MQEIYYKATRKDGTSYRDPSFSYHLGLNIHPNPDRKSESACGEGLHLGKTIVDALTYTEDDAEIYLARAGVILGEDSTKIRCSYCWLDRKLSVEETTEVKKEHKHRQEMAAGKIDPLFGNDWLQKHGLDYTQADIDNLTLTVTSGKREVTVKNKLKRKDLKVVLSTV